MTMTSLSIFTVERL